MGLQHEMIGRDFCVTGLSQFKKANYLIYSMRLRMRRMAHQTSSTTGSVTAAFKEFALIASGPAKGDIKYPVKDTA